MNKKYNLLFIFTDEQAAKTMKAYGNDIIETPNLDRLADESIVFENTYVTQPVCTPSRSSLLTGLYPHTNGCIKNNIPLSRETPCLPELGDFEDYKTAYYGKWHLGDEIFAQHGFEEWKSIEDMYYKYYSREEDKNKSSSYSEFLMEQGFRPEKMNEYGLEGFSRNFCARLPEEYSKPAYLAREANQFLDENSEEPFMLFVNFLEPHMPYFGPRDDQYDPEEIPLPENFNHELTEDAPLKVRIFREAYKKIGHSGFSLKTEADWKRLIANYWGLVSQVDTYVGEILDQLKESGQYDNTIIVFTSDHGDMMGAHRLLAKCTMFEEAVKVPLLLKIPGLTNRRISSPVSQID
ncbi:MAG: sulfatase-like hydrolase/transferase, partial [Halanaerobiaceae bacterium]